MLWLKEWKKWKTTRVVLNVTAPEDLDKKLVEECLLTYLRRNRPPAMGGYVRGPRMIGEPATLRHTSKPDRPQPTGRGFGAIIRMAFPKYADGEPVLNLAGEPASGLVWRHLPDPAEWSRPDDPCPVCNGCGDDGIYGIGHSCHVCGGSGVRVPS